MRVGIIGLLHESNTFVPEQTTLEHFEQDVLLSGEAVRNRFDSTAHELGGFFEGLERESLEAVPLFAARAIPWGPIESDTFQQLLNRMQTQVAAASPLDGILVAPHGATVCESEPDADGHWLQQLRQQIGPETPIIGTLDPHANLSPAMVAATDALVAYRTNPHLDQRERGVEAASLMARTLRDGIRPVQRAAFPPLAINIERQLTRDPHLQPLYASAETVRRLPEVLSASILLGFPWADVPEMGSAVLVVTSGNDRLAAQEAARLARQMWNSRQDFVGQFISPEQAVAQAACLDGPVCLLDMGDNVGGGAPGDSTHLLHVLRRSAVPSVLACVADARAAAQAAAAGIGQTAELEIGGCRGPVSGPPLIDRFQVMSLSDGRFSDQDTRHGGFTMFDQGPSAAVRTGDGRMTILLTTRRVPPFSLKQLTSCGLDPSAYHVVVAKGVNAPVAAYEPVCRHFIRVDTPGCTAARMTRLKYQQRRRPLFPFEDCSWKAV